jgi:hypothetical protein
MKSYLTYITEIDNIVGSGFMPDPDKFGGRFKQFNLRNVEPQRDLEKAGDIFPDTDAPRPSAHHPDSDKLSDRLKKEMDRLRDKRVRGMKNFEDYTDALAPALKPEQTKIKNVDDMMKAMERLRGELKGPMDKLDAQRSASPDHRPPGTPKPPKAADVDFDDKLKKNLANAEKKYDDMLDRAGIKPETPVDPPRPPQKGTPTFTPDPAGKGSVKDGTLGFTKKDVQHLMDLEKEFAAKEAAKKNIDAYTPEELARRDKIRGSIKKAAGDFQTSMTDQAAKLRTTPKPPSMMSRIGSIAKTVGSVAQTPAGRAALKGLAVVGAAAEGGNIGYQIQQASGLSRGIDPRDISNRVAMQRGIEDTRTRKGVFELDLPNPFGGYDHLPWAEKRKRQQELAKNIRAWEETPTTPEVTRQISPSTLKKFRTDPELERELIQSIGAAPYSDEDILRHIQRRTGARAEKQK